ncbi:hypothetical protein SOVF_149340 [Spinacia oleracea]|nr:hypothetical protein SOVF_149340 [Spinacia oleracea]
MFCVPEESDKCPRTILSYCIAVVQELLKSRCRWIVRCDHRKHNKSLLFTTLYIDDQFKVITP